MMHTPRISILMPVRDAAPWIGQAVESILGQHEGDFEFIVVDDGSRDESIDIVRRYAEGDTRLRLFFTDSDRRGLVSALNHGLALARAPLLARMDADDISDPARLGLQADALDADADLFGVTCRVVAFPEDEVGEGMQRYLDWQNSLSEPSNLLRDRFVESPAVHPSLMMRTAVLRDRLNGWRDKGWAEDWDLLLRAFERSLGLRRLPQTLLHWRMHPAQATRIDACYAAEAFLRQRAYFLARVLRDHVGSRPVWLMGAGPVGKQLARALVAENFTVQGFVDVDPAKIGGIIRYGDVRWSVIAAESLSSMSPRPFGVAAVGQPGGRARVRGALLELGWTEGEDFVVAA